MKKLSFIRAATRAATLAAVLALCLAFVGCDMITDLILPSDGGTGTDRALNGNWYQETWLRYNFNNGTFTAFGDLRWRGPYTTSGNRITMTPTEIYFESYFANDLNTTEGWRNRSQATEILQRNGWSERAINGFFEPTIATYSISGDYLYLTYEGRSYAQTFTRR